MGRIFTYEEIADQRYPAEADFSNALQTFNDLAPQAIKNGWLDGAFVFGSVASWILKGNVKVSARSDVDIALALADDRGLPNYDAAKQFISDIRKSSAGLIPIIPIIQPKRALKDARHEMDRFFGQHLRSEFRIVHGNDPAGYITFPNESAYGILLSYLTAKRRRLVNALTAPDALDLSEGNGIQRMLELAAAVGRKVLQAYVEAGYLEEHISNSADKVGLIARAQTLFDSEGVGEGFGGLVKMDNKYNELFADTVAGNVTHGEYYSEILGLHAQLPHAINWLNAVEQCVLPKLAAD